MFERKQRFYAFKFTFPWLMNDVKRIALANNADTVVFTIYNSFPCVFQISLFEKITFHLVCGILTIFRHEVNKTIQFTIPEQVR